MDSTRDQLARALAASSESLLVCDVQGRIIDANESVCVLTGYTRQDLLSKTISELADPDAGRLLSELRPDAALDLEAGLRRQDGTTERLQLRLRPLRLKDRAHSVVRIARRRRAYDRLTEDPEFIRALLQSAGTYVVAVSPEGKLVYANPPFEELWGLPFRELRGQPAAELLARPEEASLLRSRLEAFEAFGPLDLERPGPEAPRRISWTATSLRALPPAPSCLLLTGRPSHDPLRGEFEERIALLNRKLEKVRAEHEALIYTLAHDFRAPLRAMSGLSDALIEECASSRVEEEGLTYALRIAQSAQRMDALVESLLVYNRLALMSLRLERLPLGPLLGAVLQSFDSEIRVRAAGVSIELPPLEVTADRTVLHLMFSQLVSNALKFARPGVPPRIEILAERHASWVRVLIRDNGIGIPAEYHDVIFGLCERLNKSESYPGSGMGLAIVGKAVERLKGQMGLESQAGQGSCFWVDLPESPADPRK